MKVGDYVRTKDGDIFKYVKTDEDGKLRRTLNNDNENVTTGFELSNVIKSSPNIIDLIEVGDYVNGKKVTKTNLDKTMNGETAILCGNSNYDCLDVIYKSCDIKSIVTKEQFESMKYEVVD